MRFGAEHEEVGVLEGRLGRGGARAAACPPTTWWRPVPVRQLTSASGPGSSQSHTWPAAVATRSVTVPSKRTVPPARTTTRSQSAATSSVWWVESRTAQWPAMTERVRRRSARWVGSRPVVGSSSTRIRGSPSSAWASATRRRCPPDSLRDPLGGQVAEADQLEHPAYLRGAGDRGRSTP